MLASWIVAAMPESDRARFSNAQEKSATPIDCDGFIAEIAGWVDSSPRKAVILGLWRDRSSYQRRMQLEHDTFAASKSEHPILLASVIMKINESDPRILAAEAKLLRVSDARLRPACSPIFIARQVETWNPAFQTAHGMMGALLCHVDGERDRYLNASFWRTREDMDDFEQRLIPAVSEQVGLKEYIETVIAYHVRLDSARIVIAPIRKNSDE
jgi:heme-degrading monooxygenase HmoA